MTKLDLKDFERRVRVRLLSTADYPAVAELQKRCFPGMRPWLPEQLESQIRTFPEGQICVEYQGRIVGSSSSLIVDFSQYSEWHNWREIADNGYIRNHDPERRHALRDRDHGAPEVPRAEARAAALRGAKAPGPRAQPRARIIGGRIPGYGKHADDDRAREYVEKVMDKTLYDPVLTTQLSNGFVLKRLIPDYFPSDSGSRGYATLPRVDEPRPRPAGEAALRAVSTVRICVVQYEMRPVSDFGDFARQCEYFVDVASDYKADFVLFPELSPRSSSRW
jgi:hypothetical protein